LTDISSGSPMPASIMGAGLSRVDAVPGAINHSVVVVQNLDESLRFYRDGVGLDVLMDREVEGDWPKLFEGPSRRLRVVFLGDRDVPDVF
jgi:hypothetical protein